MKQAGRLLDGNPNTPRYAGTTQKTKAGAVWTGKVAMAPDHILTAPLRWRKPAMIFVNSMGDLFHESVTDEQIDRVFAIMALTPQHTYQALTKRADRMRAYLTDRVTDHPIAVTRAHAVWSAMYSEAKTLASGQVLDSWYGGPSKDQWPLPNVWLGVSVEDQARADERIPDLLSMPAAVRFISAEPLLGPLNLEAYLNPSAFCQHCDDGEGYGSACESQHAQRHEECPFRRATQIVREVGPYNADGMPAKVMCDMITLDWVIVGGESGRVRSQTRPCHLSWRRSLRDQCEAAGVPFFHKQEGGWQYVSDRADGGENFLWVGGKGSELLDGVPHHNWPEAA
jgi:protein gp37